MLTDQLVPGARAHIYSDETAAAIDDEVRGIVQGAIERTISLLKERREALERTARRLLDKETLEEAELQELAGAAPAVSAGDRRERGSLAPGWRT